MLLAHAAAVAAFRARPDAAGAEIGIVLCGDWGEPLRGGRDTAPPGLAVGAAGAAADARASERFHEFEFGWFLDPVVRGAYPASMVERVGDRLPAFSAAEAAALRGSADFVGVNFYTSQARASENSRAARARARARSPRARNRSNTFVRVARARSG